MQDACSYHSSKITHLKFEAKAKQALLYDSHAKFGIHLTNACELASKNTSIVFHFITKCAYLLTLNVSLFSKIRGR